MTDDKSRDEERDELELDKETIADLDAHEGAEDVKGGSIPSAVSVSRSD